MRIIGGSHKGKRLIAPKSIPARPTTDYAKEGLFNILQNRIDFTETEVLDLFCGIGGLSLECCSRGALSVTSIDLSYHAIRWMNQQSREWASTVHPIKMDALKWLARNENKFDLVLADPPYAYPNHTELINSVLKNALKPNGVFILEHRQSDTFAEHPCFTNDRTYGEVKFSFFDHE